MGKKKHQIYKTHQILNLQVLLIMLLQVLLFLLLILLLFKQLQQAASAVLARSALLLLSLLNLNPCEAMDKDQVLLWKVPEARHLL